VPLLGHALLREHKVPLAQWAHRRERGVAGFYARGVRWAIDHRYAVLLAAVAVLAAGVAAGPRLKTAFFPKDLSYLSYVDIWLPENSTLEATDEAARTADRVVRDVAAEFGKKKHREVLQSVTTFIGGGAPRFWFSLSPQQDQVNYAQLVVEVKDDHDTTELIAPLQHALRRVGVAPFAAVDHEPQRLHRRVGRDLRRDGARAAHRDALAHEGGGPLARVRRDEIQRAELVVGAPAPPVAQRVEHLEDVGLARDRGHTRTSKPSSTSPAACPPRMPKFSSGGSSRTMKTSFGGVPSADSLATIAR